ncbi:electron transporter [Afipia felis]
METKRLGVLLGVAIIFALTRPISAVAEVPARDLSRVSETPPPNATLPLATVLHKGNEPDQPIRSWVRNIPSIWILADFTCQSLCSPILRQTADALSGSGLLAGRDFNLFVAGIDPKDSAQDAAAMKAAQIGSEGQIAAHTTMLQGKEEAVTQLSDNLGFHAIYDKANDQFAHPAAVFVVTADGRVSRVMSGLGLDPQGIRLALVEAGKGQVGSLADHVRLLCYGFDPARGAYNFMVGRALTIGGGLTILSLGLLLGLMLRKERSVRRLSRPSA